MAVYDLEEQEQISEIKAWWETYGKLVTTAVVVVAMSSVGWQGWNWYQRKQASEASLLYVTAVMPAAQTMRRRFARPRGNSSRSTRAVSMQCWGPGRRQGPGGGR